jgi:serine/threonine-protein kinase RsbW
MHVRGQLPLNLLKQNQIQVESHLSALVQVLEWFDLFKPATIPHTVWLMCQLALAEGFTNAVRHAHRSKPKQTLIEIEVLVLSESLEFRIWDYGSAIDLNNLLESLPPSTQSHTSGRGLKLMKRIADVLTYTRTTDQRNCLLFIKNYVPIRQVSQSSEDMLLN